jgi:hypothetical protein
MGFRAALGHRWTSVYAAFGNKEELKEVRDLLVAWCRTDGDLPPGTDPGRLARCLTTFAYGIAVQAASGVCRDDLRAMADAVLRDWPLFQDPFPVPGAVS